MMKTEYVRYSEDPQLVHGLVTAGVVCITAAITGSAVIPATAIGAIVSGMLALILSAAAFKFAYEKAAPKAIAKMIADSEAYLESSKTQVFDWLGTIIHSFHNEFHTFCSNNGWEVR